MAVLVVCIAGVTAVSAQVRCIDAAREAARLVARGDGDDAEAVARRIAPSDAVVQLRRDGEFMLARVSVRSVLLPGVTIAAEAISVAEPTGI